MDLKMHGATIKFNLCLTSAFEIAADCELREVSRFQLVI
jgi:hypothetical protein